MSVELVIEGMHCNACKELISIELEENNLSNMITEISLLEGENKGTVKLSNVSDSDLTKIKKIIESMDTYTISSVNQTNND